MKRFLPTLVAFLFAIQLFPQSFPANFSRVTVGGTGAAIANPTAVAFAPDGRIFVAQQNGILRVFKNDALLTTPFVSITVNSDGERGLLGIAFDPEFTTNNYIYLYYTTTSGGLHNRISRFTANGDVAIAGSEHIILELDPLSSASNHNGGALAFGKDGKLYVAIGENANGSYAQNREVYHGKFLRINKDGSAPVDNPFQESEHSRRIWSLGLRNPYTFSIHPTSGRIFVNDVGQGTWEEVNDATASGKNFGWPTTEGATTNPLFTSPFYAYDQSNNVACAITGGTFFSPANTNYPVAYAGKYFFQDLCGDWINYIDASVSNPTPVQFGTSVGGQSLGLTAGNDGNLYYLSRSASRLYRIVYTPVATAPVITAHPQPATRFVGQGITFNVTATGTTPFTYQWQKNSVNINGATLSSLVINNAQLTDAAQYRVVVTNLAGNATSNQALLTVNPPPPIPTITQQPVPLSVVVGQPATFTVAASGDAPLSYQWFKNDVAISGQTQTTFTIATIIQADAGTYHVTVTNPNGTLTSNKVALTVSLPNQPPVAQISKPLGTDTYRAGTSLAFEGTGTDAEDGDLPAANFMWDIHFHHDTHWHDQPMIPGIKSGEFAIPDRGETSSNVWYRIKLTVVDSKGVESKDSVDVYPFKSDITFTTVPPGLQIFLDGQPFTTPLTVTSVEGLKRDIGIPEGQSTVVESFNFASWSIGGEATQTITTPAENTTYTATFSIVTGIGEESTSRLVYPNPVSGTINISDPTVHSVHVINSVGKTILLTPVPSSGKTTVDIAGLSPGVYVLFFEGESGVSKTRVIVSR